MKGTRNRTIYSLILIILMIVASCSHIDQSGVNEIDPLLIDSERDSTSALDERNNITESSDPQSPVEEKVLDIISSSLGEISQEERLLGGNQGSLEPAPGTMWSEREALAGIVLADDSISGYDQGVFYADDMLDDEKYRDYGYNPRTSPIIEPLSTFSIDVDTASYANTRRYLFDYGYHPPVEAIRVEEFVNYFDYDYPQALDHPFFVETELAPSPFDENSFLLKIGLQGRESSQATRPAANLVFLIDVSGSMSSPNKLPLLKESFEMLLENLSGRDRISMVVYAGAAGVVLEGAPGDSNRRITRALGRLEAGGSTAGGQGIELAYSIAEEHFIEGGINRVILASDGDFNVGITDHRELIEMIEDKRDGGVALTVLGFGSGNLNDRMMEQIADHGNGNYYYIDTDREAKKVLVDQMLSTIEIIASDVKIQVEFNPTVVQSYRLLGYENRRLEHEDFDDDKIDAGEIGAGHSVTALYEIHLMNWDAIESNRYSNSVENLLDLLSQSESNQDNGETELAFVRLRYKNPGEDESSLIERVVRYQENLETQPSQDFYFAASVAYFAQVIKENPFVKDLELAQVYEIAKSNIGLDNYGFRSEFLEIVQTSMSLN